MKTKFAWPFVAALITLVASSCGQNVDPEPEPIHVDGLYQAVYVSPDEDMPHLNINLEVKHDTDTTLLAQMAFYNYYKDNLLYSEVTEACVPVIKSDTLLLDFVVSDGNSLGAMALSDRHLNVKLRYSQDTLRLLSSSDGDILPDDLLLFHKALTPEDSAAICFDATLPRMTMLEGMYFINGPIKKFGVASSAGAHGFEYFFDENGIVTGYKDSYGKMIDYEVGEIGDGAYYSLLKRNGWKSELSYNALHQLVSDNTRLNLTSYDYDQHGRMTDGFFKNSKAFYAFELERDAHGTLIGIRNKYSDKYIMKYIIEKTDNHGNPLEQSIDYCNGHAPARFFFEYEYYK